MRKALFLVIAAAALVVLNGTNSRAQSYSNAVVALNPVAYWPLTETTPPPAQYIATNSGTLGAVGNGYYETWWAPAGNNSLYNTNTIGHIAGAINGDADKAMQQGIVGQYVVIPRSTNGVANPAVTLTAPFSMELWVFPTNSVANQLKPILVEGFNNVQAGANLNYQTVTRGTAIGQFSSFIYFVTFNGVGTKTEIDTGTLTMNTWYHFVATFDGTTQRFYQNGVQVGTGKNPPADPNGQVYVPDLVSPLIVGGGNELGLSGGANTFFGGGIDEVAIYTNVLSQAQALAHYQAGTNASRSIPYAQTIASDNPGIYLRLNEPAYPVGTTEVGLPAASNYGSLGALANGVYLPGTAPGIAGPAYTGFGAPSLAVALDGFNAGVDVGGGSVRPEFNRTNNQPMTVTAWFQANPSDCVGRFQAIMGHTDASWRLTMDNNAGNRFNPGNGPELSFANVYEERAAGMFLNDGNWHFAAGVSDGTSDYLYLDGILVKSNSTVGSIVGSVQDVILGGDPQYLGPSPGGGRFFDGNIAQAAFFTNALTAAQIQQVFSAAHVPPVIRLQPVSQAAFTGQSIALTTTASGSSSLTYNWYKNNTQISTGPTPSLNFGSVASGDNGSYFVVVTNLYGSATSSVVQLTVSGTASAYGSAVKTLNPVAYWPLSETVAPPSGQYVANNLGTLGAAANGYYESWYQPNGTSFYATNYIQRIPGTTGDGDTAMVCGGTLGAGQYVIFPHATNGVANPAVTIQAPFTIEAWLKTTNSTAGVRPVVNQGRNSIQGDASVGYNNVYAGFSLGQFQGKFYFQLYATNANANTGPELDMNSVTLNTWYHVVVTFDGTTEIMYSNGVSVASAPAALNGAGLRYVPDTVSPLLIGTGTTYSGGNGGTEFMGAVDDVAIYPSVLSQTQIANHYAAASGSGYAATVLADSPSIYVRLDEAPFNSYPSPNTYPAATNYGSLGASANGLYQPGSAPGAAGPPFSGFGGSSRSVAINGFYGGVDVGGGNLPYALNPVGFQPFTVTTWFQGNPADAPARLQSIVGHGTNTSWRLTMDGGPSSGSTLGAGIRFNPGNGPELGFVNTADVVTNGFRFNDGNWHFAAGVSDGTSEYLYLDGVLARSNSPAVSIPGNALDAILGGDPVAMTPIYNAPNIRYFDGQIAQVAFFTNALSSAQIQQLYSVAGVPPSITQQPAASITTNAGANVTVPVGVNRAATPLSYRWYATNGVFVTGQTNSSLIFNPVTLANAGSYYLIVTNLYGAATSSVVQLSVFGPPVVQQQSLTDIKVFVGTTPILNVTSAGSPPLSYQWQSNGVPIPGATSSSYRVTGTGALGTNLYTCVITNSFSLSSPTTNTPIAVAVLPDPTAPYPAAVLADLPSSYFRLDEPNFYADGTVAYDYAGGYNAVYITALTGQGGYSSLSSPNTDPFETSVGFGQSTLNDSLAGNAPAYLDFATNGNAEFAVEAWVNAPFGASTDAGIVTLGYGFGGEQFNLDAGGRNGSVHTYRFSVTDASGASHNASSLIAPGDGLWHHLVGVCDEAGGHIYLYIDGVLRGSGTVAANAGIRTFSAPLSIGSRMGTAGDSSFTNQFQGFIDDVAIYKTALTSAQIGNHYFAAGIAPVITGLTPTNKPAVNENTTVQLTVSASGTPSLSYQWLDNFNNPIPWGTSATLTLTNVTSAQAGTYTVNVGNTYGTASTNAVLTVYTGSPVIAVDLQPTNSTVYAGTIFTYTVTVNGSAPFTYVWTRNGATIAGATSSSYTFSALQGTNNYQVTVSNGTPPPVSSAIATLVGFPSPVLDPLSFNYKTKISFAGYNRNETLVDFPMLVRLGTNLAGFSSSQFASPTGGDLRFTSANGTNEIPYEIDEWNPNGVSSVWVQVPALSNTTNYIWAYWGNPAATTPPDYSTNGTVWVPPSFLSLPGYEIVYHLKEGALPFADSTLQFPALSGVAPAATPGVVGQGGAFTGTEWLDAGTVNLGDAFTLSAWIDVNPSVSDIQTIWANQVGGFGNAGFAFGVNTFQAFNQKIYLASGDGTHLGGRGLETSTAANAVTFGQWHLLDAAINRTNGTVVFSVDGNPVFSGAVVSYFTNQADVNFGRFDSGSFNMHGAMDEARIRQGISSTNWIWAEYMTVASNTPFASYSSISSSIVNLSINQAGPNIVLTWPSGTLQAAGLVTGPYTNVLSATSPYTNAPTGPQRFFRVLVR